MLTGAEPWEIESLIKSHHYSRRMPANIQHAYVARKIGGLFGETGAIRAAVVFSIPPSRWSERVIELSRLVRLPDYAEPLSKLIAFGCRRLVLNGWVLAISFADWTQRHHGGVYQAAGWNYAGCREKRMDGLLIDGTQIEPHFDEGKHLYWRPLTVGGKTMAKRLGLECLPYPKPIAASPSDEQAPACASEAQPLVAAPIQPKPAKQEVLL